MPPFFSTARNHELSALDYLTTEINVAWTGVTLVKTFARVYDKDVDPPIVSLRLDNSAHQRREVGSTILVDAHNIIIDIFARSDAQRLDLAYFIIDKLRLGWVYYQFAHAIGDNSTLTKTVLGRATVIGWNQDTRLDFGDNVDAKDRYRHLISITVRHV